MARSMQLIPRKYTFPLLYLSTFFFSFHHFFVTYYNSSYISTYIHESLVGLVYVVGSFLSVLALVQIPRALKRFGNYKILLWASLLEFVAFLGLAFIPSTFAVIPIFILNTVFITVIFLNFDILLEHNTSQNNEGTIRGTFLTITNIALIIAPLLAGYMLGDGEYQKIYLLSALFLIPFILLIRSFRNFEDPQYHKINILGTLSCIRGHKNLYNIFMTQFLMRFFFSWAVIYMPIYLHTVIGFNWAAIGTMTAIILLPYVLLEYPAGRIADKYLGEKEMLMLGFVIAGFATIYTSFITIASFLVWTVTLFIGRAGMSLVEIMSESYFFKHVDENDSNTIRFFRITRPAAYVIGPLFGTIFVALFPLQYIWIAAGLILFSGIYFANKIEDTK